MGPAGFMLLMITMLLTLLLTMLFTTDAITERVCVCVSECMCMSMVVLLNLQHEEHKGNPVVLYIHATDIPIISS